MNTDREASDAPLIVDAAVATTAPSLAGGEAACIATDAGDHGTRNE